MNCDHCDGELVVFAVPEDLREFAPGEGATASLCATCLRLDAPPAGTDSPGDSRADSPANGTPDADSSFAAVSDAFPSGRGGVALALLVGKLDSLALNRAAVETLVEEAERAGTDPFLAFDRLADDGSVEPHFDFERRRQQFESLFA